MITRKYPLGQQDFPSIRKEGKVYVDKTMYAHLIIETSKSNFLSKPRRFGKSLFLSTLESIFLGKKELFEGLYIYDKWQFEEYPIIRISFSNIGYREMGLDKAIDKELDYREVGGWAPGGTPAVAAGLAILGTWEAGGPDATVAASRAGD